MQGPGPADCTPGRQLLPLLLLLLLSRVSRVRLCATPRTAAHQALPSLGFSRQEHRSGLPFPSPMHERKSEREAAQSCLTLSDPMDCSPPGSSVHGTFQARALEWVPLPSPLLPLVHRNRDGGEVHCCFKAWAQPVGDPGKGSRAPRTQPQPVAWAPQLTHWSEAG